MKLTNEILGRFEGGQLDINNIQLGYHYRGGVKKAGIEGGMLRIQFNWCAKRDDGGQWHQVANDMYAVWLYLIVSTPSNGDEICFEVERIGESCRFFPIGSTGLIDPPDIP